MAISFHFISFHYALSKAAFEMSSDLDTLTTPSSSERVDKLLTKIRQRSEQLQTNGMTLADRDKASFNNVIDSFTRLESYEPYRLNLGPAAKKFFESTAAEQGFTGSRPDDFVRHSQTT